MMLWRHSTVNQAVHTLLSLTNRPAWFTHANRERWNNNKERTTIRVPTEPSIMFSPVFTKNIERMGALLTRLSNLNVFQLRFRIHRRRQCLQWLCLVGQQLDRVGQVSNGRILAIRRKNRSGLSSTAIRIGRCSPSKSWANRNMSIYPIWLTLPSMSSVRFNWFIKIWRTTNG